MTSDNNNPWDEPTRWDASRPAEETPAPADNVAPPPVPPAAPPTAMPVFGTPTPPAAPTPPPAAPPVVTPPDLAPPPAPPVPAASAPGTAIGSQPVPTMPPPVNPAGQPLLSGNYGGTDLNAPVAPSGGNGRFAWIAAIVGALALLGGGAFFAISAFGASGGGETPEDAVDQILAAINGEDFLTMGELLEPGERRTVVEPMLTDILPELKRLGVFNDGLDPADVEGVDLELTDVDYRIEPLAGNDDIQHVYFTSGTASSESVAAEFPWGDAIRDRFGDNIEDSPRTTEDITESETPIVLVERDGRWYFSMWHTVGEAIRLETGDPLPLVGDAPPALGSDSPEEAVEAMIAEMVDLDLRGMIGRMDPEEAAALYRYSPLFLGEAQSELNNFKRDVQAEGISWDITNLTFDTETDGDDASVTIRSFTATVTTPDVDVEFTWASDRIFVEANGTIDGEEFSGSLEITPRRWTLQGSAAGENVDIEVLIDSDAETITLSGSVSGESIDGSFALDETGGCSEYTFRGLDADESGCLEEVLGDGGLNSEVRDQFTSFFTGLDTEFPGIPMAVHRTDGSWYVSPTLTVMDAMTNGMRELTREDFEDFLDQVEDGSDTATFGIEDLIEAPFDAAADNAFDDIDGLITGDDSDVFEDPTFDDSGFDDEPEGTTETFSATAGPDAEFFFGTLGPADTHEYVIQMAADETLGVTLFGTTIDGGIGDPVVSVRGPDGFEVAFNDDAVGLDSALSHTADTTGAYTIIVQDLSAQPGNYELGLELEASGETPAIVDGVGGGFDSSPTEETTGSFTAGFNIETGGVFSAQDSLDANAFDVFEFTVTGATELTIDVVGNDGLDPNIVILDANGSEVGYNDDALSDAGLPGIFDSQLVIFLSEGSYIAEVHSFGDNGSGSYNLTVTAN